MPRAVPVVDRDSVVRFWLHRQGLSVPRGQVRLSKRSFVDHLERTGAIQLDSVNVLDRAHYLTLWSRFGPYDRKKVDRWVYRERAAYEYWGHEASILPMSHLPVGRRRMRRFPPKSWSDKAWWAVYQTSTGSKRRVLRRLREEGPLESANFERRDEFKDGNPWGAIPMPKEDTRSLKLLWHDGRIAVSARRHFRCVYDLAERVYPEGPVASPTEFEDSWLLTGLSGNGVVSEAHLMNYITAPGPKAADRKRIIARNLRKGRMLEVRVQGTRGASYVLPDHLEALSLAPVPTGTHLICPFDSMLWQRKRTAQLLGFNYTVEIYTPAKKRRYGYYVLPILHEGRMVGRVDPKVHRDRGLLEVKSVHLEPDFIADRAFDQGLGEALHSLRAFLGAEKLKLPRGWGRRI